MLRLMAITAHPDDEVANFGGSLRLYRDRGMETSVVCLTPGQAASNRGGAKSDQELAAIRKKEFAAACEILGVSRGVVLDYPDGQLHRQDGRSIVRDLARHIREFRPHVLLTFGPDGGLTGHTDHSMASMFATLAFHWAGRDNRFPNQISTGLAPHGTEKLYYATANFQLPGRAPVSMSPVTTAIDISNYYDIKIAAFRAHVTQAHLLPIFEKNVGSRGRQEMYHLASGVKLGTAGQETDLFAGIGEKA